MIYNVIAIPFAAGVWFPWTHTLVPPQYAGLSMALSSISVVLSSAALRLYRKPLIRMHAPGDGDAHAGMKHTQQQQQGPGGGGILKRAARRLVRIKNSLQNASSRSYRPLAQQEQEGEGEEAVNAFGLQLGIGGMRGLRGGARPHDDGDDDIV